MEKGIFNNFHQYLINSFEADAIGAGEPAWLKERRTEAFGVFKAKGFPSRKHEEWRFANPERFLDGAYAFHTDRPAAKTVPEEIAGLDACRIFIVNGRFEAELSDQLPDGITFLDDARAWADTRFSEKFASIAADPANAMLALNTAFFRHCSLLHIAAKAVVEKPVHISHIYTAEAEAAFVPYRTLVLAEKLSEATVIETFHSDSLAPVFVSYVSEQQVDESAVFHSHIVDNAGQNVALVHHREVLQFRNSVLNNSNIQLGNSRFIRNDLNFRLKESGTETNLLGAYILTGDQHVDNHTLVDHQMPHCNSNELYKGILHDRSHGVFNGKVFVQPDAQKTNAFQQNNNLLLSDKATINSKPQLEIFADDVKCSHGSTVGQMNQEAMFYLRTRGIGEETARRLLMGAFIFDVLSQIELAALRDYTAGLLHKKFRLTENLVIA